MTEESLCKCVCLDCIAGNHCGGVNGPCLMPSVGIYSDEFNRDFYGDDSHDENDPEIITVVLVFRDGALVREDDPLED